MRSEGALFWRRKAKEKSQSLGKTSDQRWERISKLRTLRSSLWAGRYSGGASLVAQRERILLPMEEKQEMQKMGDRSLGQERSSGV